MSPRRERRTLRVLPPFNPLDKRNLGLSVADALLTQEPQPLPPEPFVGAGIYAIYYVGDFAPYQRIAMRNADGNWDAPIYVGKAVPEGARKGNVGVGVSPGQVLYRRLREHSESVSAANNLDLSHFFCRYLVVEDIWIPLGESLLIQRFAPLWNQVLDGFGNHDPGAGRYAGQRSLWDMIHPGRPWAERSAPHGTPLAEIQAAVDAFLGR